MQAITAEQLVAAPYTAFVGLVGQTNVPPGSYQAINAWRIFSDLNERSRLLEVACTTGFSSRELVMTSGCHAVGFDLRPEAVAEATEQARLAGLSDRLSYVAADGTQFTPSFQPTHIVVGAALRFFPDPAAMLSRMVGWFGEEGYLLSADFSTREAPSEAFMKTRFDTFGLTSTPPRTAQAREIYKGLDTMYETEFQPRVESEAELAHYCESTIDRFCERHAITDKLTREAALERLLSIKRSANFLRESQVCHIGVYRYRRAEFPRRFVELF